MVDRFKRDIFYLRISVTDRCNLRGIYCIPAKGIKLKRADEILSYEKIIQIADKAAKLGIHKIRLTGGEPLVRKNISFLISKLKAIEGIQEVSMTTNGVLLAPMASELKEAGLDRLNISLDALDPELYKYITRGGDVFRVLTGIEAALEAGFKKTKINMVILPGLNQSNLAKMAAFCQKKGLTLQRINRYFLSDRKSLIQATYEVERPLPCSQCNRIRLTADGKLKPCLFSDQEYSLNSKNITAVLKRTIRSKPRSGLGCTTRGNWQIGG